LSIKSFAVQRWQPWNHQSLKRNFHPNPRRPPYHL